MNKPGLSDLLPAVDESNLSILPAQSIKRKLAEQSASKQKTPAMKLIPAAIILFILCACNNTGKRYHDGTYVYTDTTGRNPCVQKITIDGKWMYHTVHSTENNSLVKKYKFICIQYPHRINLPLTDGHSVIVEIDSSENLIYDDHLFKKEPSTIIIPTPVPKAFQEKQE